MEQYETVTEAIDALRNRGYTADFNLLSDCLECLGNPIRLHPEDFEVDSYYRFEGMTDPSDAAIVYAISSEKYDLKGVLVNGYGVSSEPITAALLAKLQ